MMMLKISDIQVEKRIRNEAGKIEELAADIKENGLLNPVTVMPLDSGRYQLLAGLRRLKACISLGMTEIMSNVIPVENAEHALRIEFSENEQRENFTFSEKMDYAALLEKIEKAKADERKSLGGKGGIKQDVDRGPHLDIGKTRDAVGAKIGLSGRQYDRAKFVADNAPTELIHQIDDGKISVKKAYTDLRSKEKTEVIQTSTESPERESTYDAKIRRLKPNKLILNPHYSELKSKFEAARCEANVATSKMFDMETNHKNQMYHFESIKSMLERRIETLEAALVKANARIIELGGEPI